MKEEYKKIFKIYGFNLKKIREYRKVTIKELAIKTKIRERYLRKIEKGEAYGLTTTKIFIIADALETPAHLFMNGI